MINSDNNWNDGVTRFLSFCVELLTEIHDVDTVLAERRDTMDPELLAVIEANLALIDAAMADIDAALAAAPDDPELRAAMVATWRKRITLLERARALTDS